MNNNLHHYGLVRFSKKTGKIDKSMTALGNGLIQLWALQNTTPTKACVILDLDDSTVYREYHGDKSGFPRIIKNPDEFEFDIPMELFIALNMEVIKDGKH